MDNYQTFDKEYRAELDDSRILGATTDKRKGSGGRYEETRAEKDFCAYYKQRC